MQKTKCTEVSSGVDEKSRHDPYWKCEMMLDAERWNPWDARSISTSPVFLKGRVACAGYNVALRAREARRGQTAAITRHAFGRAVE